MRRWHVQGLLAVMFPTTQTTTIPTTTTLPVSKPSIFFNLSLLGIFFFFLGGGGVKGYYKYGLTMKSPRSSGNNRTANDKFIG